MITSTAREIISHATTLANARNTSFVDFQLATNLLNTEYRKLYDDVITNALDFVKSFTLTSKETALPDDCYYIISVVDNKTGVPLMQSPAKNPKYDGYYVENGIIYAEHWNNVVVKYAPIPDTITAPDEAVEVDTSVITVPTDNKPYALKGTTADSLSFTAATATDGYYSFNYIGGKLFISEAYDHFYWIDSDTDPDDFLDYEITDLFTYSEFGNDYLPINVQVSDPYIIVSYGDDSLPIFIYTGWNKAEWNYNIIFGKRTYGKIIAFTSNDLTGYGVVWHNPDDDSYYYCSFVPDTVLSYPTSVLFTLLEYRVAATILGLLNLDNNYLVNELLPNAEIQFYKTLSFGCGTSRITNATRGTYALY